MSDHTPRTAKKSTDNFGRPASTNSDSYIRTLFEPGLADTQYNIDFLQKSVNNTVLASRRTTAHIELQDQYTNIYIAID